jgi:di/tricarboxylate transporter
LDVKVVAVRRDGKKHLAPAPDYTLQGDDLLLVDGKFDDLQELMRAQGLAVKETDPRNLEEIFSQFQGAILRLRKGSGLIDRTLSQLNFRHRFGVLVVGIRRGDELLRQQLGQEVLREDDTLLVLCNDEQLTALREQKACEVVADGIPARSLLHERLFLLRVPATSSMAGSTVGNSRLGELVGLTIIGILRQGQTLLAVTASEEIRSDDELLISGEPTRLLDLMQLGDLQIEDEIEQSGLESEAIGVVEAIIAPRSRLANNTLSNLHFRDRYGLQVLTLWRGGEARHRELATLPLAIGDALLLHGEREKIQHLSEDPDFVVLSHQARPARRTSKAPVALGSLFLMVALVASGLYPIHVAAFAGAVASVLFGALKMEEAYRAIEWRALFLVAAILPVGGAMEKSGAAGFLAESVVGIAGDYGPYAFLAALALLSSLLSQGLDGAPTVVILAPVVLLTAEQLGVSPYPLMMVVGLAASAAFMTPFSHKANLLVMSAGGYKAMDYVKVGTPLTIAILALLVIMVPIFFPL